MASEVAQKVYAEIIQIGINCGIPFNSDVIDAGQIAYLHETVIWVTFILGLAFKGLGKLMGSMIGSVR